MARRFLNNLRRPLDNRRQSPNLVNIGQEAIQAAGVGPHQAPQNYPLANPQPPPPPPVDSPVQQNTSDSQVEIPSRDSAPRARDSLQGEGLKQEDETHGRENEPQVDVRETASTPGISTASLISVSTDSLMESQDREAAERVRHETAAPVPTPEERAGHETQEQLAQGRDEIAAHSSRERVEEPFRRLEDLVFISMDAGVQSTSGPGDWSQKRFETFCAEDFPRIIQLAQREADSRRDAMLRFQYRDAPSPSPLPSPELPGSTPPSSPGAGAGRAGPGVPSEQFYKGGKRVRNHPMTAEMYEAYSPPHIPPILASPIPANDPRYFYPLSRMPPAAHSWTGGREQTACETLLGAQKKELEKLLSDGDFRGACETIQDILDNSSLKVGEAKHLVLKRVWCLQMLGRWRESITEAIKFQQQDVSAVTSTTTGTDYYANMAYKAAEAHFHLQEYKEARVYGSRALHLYQKGSHRPQGRIPGALRDVEMTVELLAKIVAKMGRKLEEEFYRSLVIDGPVSEPFKMVEVRKRIDKRNEFLSNWGLSSTCNVFGDKFKIQGPNSDLVRAFKESLMGSTSPISEASRREYLLSLLLHDKSINALKDADCDNKSALYYAIYYDNPECVNTLIEQGAEANGRIIEPVCRPEFFPSQPLAIAARLGRKQIVETLLRNGATVDGDTPADPLMQLEEDVMFNFLGTTPLHEAVLYGQFEIAETLLNSGAEIDVFARSPYFYEDSVTALHVAAITGNLAILQTLLNRGASVRRITYERGNSLLHLAAVAGVDPAVLHLLHTHGVNVNWVNDAGQTPLDYLHAISGRFDNSLMSREINMTRNSETLVALGGVFRRELDERTRQMNWQEYEFENR